MSERLEDMRTALKQKLCRHNALPVYEEVRTKEGLKVRWSAFYVCPLCGDVVSVEASFYGNPFRVGEAVEEEISRWGEPQHDA